MARIRDRGMMIEEITLGEWSALLLVIAPLGLFVWGLMIIILIKIFKGDW